jgi:hypothetical protein
MSKRNGLPVDLMAHLLEHFTEESVLGFQQAVTEKGMAEAARGLSYEAEYMASRDEFYEGYVAATQKVDPEDVYYAGPYPSEIVTFT